MKQLIWAGAALVIVFGAARVAWLMIKARENEERRQALRESFAVESNVGLTELERFVGFSRLRSRSYPQVSQQGPLESVTHWRAVVHHGGHQAVMRDGAQGLIVETSDDGQNRVSRIQFDLPDSLRAERWEDVVWIAFVYRSMLEEQYEYVSQYAGGRSEDAPITVERVDVRLVTWQAGRLAGRGTAGAVPTTGVERHRPQLFSVRAPLLITLVSEVFRAAVEASEEEPAGLWNGE